MPLVDSSATTARPVRTASVTSAEVRMDSPSLCPMSIMPNMDSSSHPVSSPPPADPSSGPPSEELLRAIARVAPQLWFPLRHAEMTGVPRDSLDVPLWNLQRAGMVQVADWIAGLGQGFQLTRAGEKAVDHPNPLSLVDSTNPRTATDSDAVAKPSAPALRRAIVAPAILVANVLWFAVGAFLAWQAGVGVEYLKGESQPASSQTLLLIGALKGTHLLSGEWWRLLSNCFVHMGLFHLFGNMLMLGILGPVSEGLWGRRRFAVLYLAAGLAGSCTAIALRPLVDAPGGARETMLAGASGALWGVLFSVIVWLVRYREKLPDGVAKEWGRRLLFAVLLNLMLSFTPGLESQISVEGHLGGGFAGAALAYWLDRRWRPGRWLSLLGTALFLGVFSIGLFLYSQYSDEWKPLRQTVQRR